MKRFFNVLFQLSPIAGQAQKAPTEGHIDKRYIYAREEVIKKGQGSLHLGSTSYHIQNSHNPLNLWSIHVAERLALPTLDHGVVGLNPAGGEILPEPKRRFIAQSLSCSPFHCLEMTEILLKGR